MLSSGVKYYAFSVKNAKTPVLRKWRRKKYLLETVSYLKLAVFHKGGYE